MRNEASVKKNADNQKKDKACILCFNFFWIACLTIIFNISVYAESGLDKQAAVTANYNVILIALDSIRADHLSCYGYKKNTSSAINKLATEGMLFEQAISQSTWSLPSHCSIFTSKYVPAHGVDELNKKLSDSELTLPEILKIYGYKTAAFTGGFWINSIFNLGQGFDLYQDKLLFAKMKVTSSRAINWLKKHRHERFFLFLQGFDGHSPFNLPKEYEKMYTDPGYKGVFRKLTLDHRIGDRLFGRTFYLDYGFKAKINLTDKDIDYIIAHYDGSISYADYYIGKFLEKLSALNLRENTIIIFTSYHGTPLFEHGIILRRRHGGGTEGTIHVPLIISHPGFKHGGLRYNNQVQLIDIMPTILDFLGIPVNHQAQGRSLVPLIEGRAEADFNKYVYSEGYRERIIRTNEWKLIEGQDKGLELYNIINDPREQSNLVKQESKVSIVLKHKLGEWYKEQKPEGFIASNIVDQQEIQKIKTKMQNAGYWFLNLPEENEAVGRTMPKGLKGQGDNNL